MPYRSDVFRPGHYYHLYNRGVGGDAIFFNPGNYEYCLQLMERHSQQYSAAIMAYCLMPNHYHLLVRQDGDKPLSTFIQVLFNAYVQAVNHQQARRGPLFEGRFRHVRVDRDEYLIHLCRYIHLNPVRARLVQSPEQWPYSDYVQWVAEPGGSSRQAPLIHLPDPGTYRSFVADYLGESPPPGVHKYLLD